jgi:hypothetical protein
LRSFPSDCAQELACSLFHVGQYCTTMGENVLWFVRRWSSFVWLCCPRVIQARSMKFGAFNWSCVAFLPAFAACTGVQTGDQGDDVDGCVYLPPAGLRLDETASGTNQTARDTLGAVFDVQGSVATEDGETHAVTLAISLDEDTLHEVLVDETKSEDCKVRGPELQVEGTAMLGGDGLLEGTAPVQVRALDSKIWITVDGRALTRVPETDLGSDAALSLNLFLDTDCQWNGDAAFLSLDAAECEAEPCSGARLDPVGDFTAPGTCVNQ